MNDRHYIGGGNIAGILGVSPYKSPLDEYLGIIGEREVETPERESFFRRRKSFEPVAAEAFTEQTGLAIVAANRRLTDREHPFIKAELDLETADGANVEVKTCHPLAARDWGPAGEDACPVYVTAQAMHGLMVSERDLAYVLAMIGFDDIRVYRIERDDETVTAIRKREVEFWHSNVMARVPPPATTVGDMLKLFTKDSGKLIEATPELSAHIDELRRLKADAKRIDEIEDEIKVYMRDAATLAYEGSAIATWKTQIANRFAQREFEAAHPQLFQQFKRASESRVLRIK